MNQSLTFDLTDTLRAVEASGLFTSLCSLFEPSQAVDGLGQVDLSNYTPIAGLVNIPCMRAPLSTGERLTATERKTQTEIAEEQGFHVLLDGYYPTILQRYLALIDGDPFDVVGVEWDSQHVMTRMHVRRYNL